MLFVNFSPFYSSFNQANKSAWNSESSPHDGQCCLLLNMALGVKFMTWCCVPHLRTMGADPCWSIRELHFKSATKPAPSHQIQFLIPDHSCGNVVSYSNRCHSHYWSERGHISLMPDKLRILIEGMFCFNYGVYLMNTSHFCVPSKLCLLWCFWILAWLGHYFLSEMVSVMAYRF